MHPDYVECTSMSFKLIIIFWKTITSIKCWWVWGALSEGGGHAVDDVAEDLLEPSEPVSDLPESAVSQGALHAVAGTCIGILWDIWKNMMYFLNKSLWLSESMLRFKYIANLANTMLILIVEKKGKSTLRIRGRQGLFLRKREICLRFVLSVCGIIEWISWLSGPGGHELVMTVMTVLPGWAETLPNRIQWWSCDQADHDHVSHILSDKVYGKILGENTQKDVLIVFMCHSPSDLPILEDLVMAFISMLWLNCSATV